jgi:hypothetical protein
LTTSQISPWFSGRWHKNEHLAHQNISVSDNELTNCHGYGCACFGTSSVTLVAQPKNRREKKDHLMNNFCIVVVVALSYNAEAFILRHSGGKLIYVQ